MVRTVNVGAVPGSEAFLLLTENRAVLVDAGFGFCAEQMVEKIKEALGGRSLDYIFLTHSHYDHVSGVPACKKAWKDVVVVAPAYAQKILSKESAMAVIADMDTSAARESGMEGYVCEAGEIPVDKAVEDGEVIDIGDLKFQVIATPGHTKCTMAYYCEEEKLLISNETIGVRIGDAPVCPCFLVGYAMTRQSLEKVAELKVSSILLPHYGMTLVEDSEELFRGALQRGEDMKEFILEQYRRGEDVQGIVEAFVRENYYGETKKAQPEKAFRLNAEIMTKLVLKECLDN